MKNISASFIFAGGDSLVLFEGTDKVAQIIKAIPVGDLRDGIIGGEPAGSRPVRSAGG